MELDPVFLPNNLHHESIDIFRRSDPNLRRLRDLKYVYRSGLLARLPRDEPGIYSVGGGRQVGKTTLLKQWMLDLLEDQVKADRMAFFTGELIDDHHALVRIIQQTLGSQSGNRPVFVIVDEVTYIREWDRGIKYLADTGVFDNCVVILTGSDLTFLKKARMRFPGRRGRSDVVDFHLYPLSFAEFVDLKGHGHRALINEALDAQARDTAVPLDDLFRLFDSYLIHGGYLPAINDMALDGKIRPATLATYSEWLRGDILKRGKKESLLRELLSALIAQAGSQLTWHSLSRMTSIDHHKTISDYVEALELMDAVFVQYALQEHTLTGAPKKARKVFFTDPFIYHCARAWITPVRDPFVAQIKPLLNSPEEVSTLVETAVVSHYRRFYPCYYIKSRGEVDIAYVDRNRFFPVEVKWTRQIRPKDVKEVQQYPQSVILGNVREDRRIGNTPVVPLPSALLALCTDNADKAFSLY